MTDQQIQRQLEILEKQPLPKKRIWEVDFVRGLLILLVTFDHFMFDCAFLFNFKGEFGIALKTFAKQYYLGYNWLGDVRHVIQYSCIMLFVFIAGLSCALSKSNFKRGAKMAGFAFLFTFATYSLDAFGFSGMTISFNVIHVIALCVLLWALIDFVLSKLNQNGKNIIYCCLVTLAVAILVVGYLYLNQPIKEPLTHFQSIFVENNTLPANSTGDYLVLFPAMGWFLIGAMCSKLLYKEKCTLFGAINEKYFAPITFCGKYCLFIYVGAQIAFVAIGALFGWL